MIETWKSTREVYLEMWKYVMLAEANREIMTQNIRMLQELEGEFIKNIV